MPMTNSDGMVYMNALVTCHTEGCTFDNVPQGPVVLYKNPVAPLWRSFCGSCGTYNEDIVEVF